MDRNKFHLQTSFLQDVTISLQILLPFIGLSTLRDWKILSLFGCRKSNVPLIPDLENARFAQFPLFPYREMCQNIEYVDNLLNDVQTCLKQTLVWAAFFVLISSIYSCVSKACKLGKPVNSLNLWLKTSTTGFCLQIFYYRYSFNSLLKFVRLLSNSLVSFGEWTKSFIASQLDNNPFNVYFPSRINQWILLNAVVITIGTLLLCKNVWNRRQDSGWKRLIREKNMKSEAKEISLFDISTASFDCEMLDLKNQMLLANQRIITKDSKRQPKILLNIFSTAFMDFIYSRVKLLCRSVARKHDLNDSESMLLRWTCFGITNTLIETKGNLCQNNHKIETLLKLGSMLNWNSQTFSAFRLLENSKVVSSADTSDQDIFFNIFFEQNHIILRSKILNISSMSYSDDRLILCHSHHFPFPQRLQQRITDYKVLSFYGSAQRINGALKDFESKAVRFLKVPFTTEEDIPNESSQVKRITPTEGTSSRLELEATLESEPVDVEESWLRNVNRQQLFNNIPTTLPHRCEKQSRNQMKKKKNNFKEFLSNLTTKSDIMRNKLWNI